MIVESTSVLSDVMLYPFDASSIVNDFILKCKRKIIDNSTQSYDLYYQIWWLGAGIDSNTKIFKEQTSFDKTKISPSNKSSLILNIFKLWWTLKLLLWKILLILNLNFHKFFTVYIMKVGRNTLNWMWISEMHCKNTNTIQFHYQQKSPKKSKV